MKLNKKFFNKDARVVAKNLLGKIIVRKINNTLLKARIVETEAYIGKIDKACHAYGDKRTKRTETLYSEPGTAYVYLIYGLYNCLNFVTNEVDCAEGVIIRAVEPLAEFDKISILRYNKEYDKLTKYEKKNISNGPGKLCSALNITREQNNLQTTTSNELYVEEPSHNYKLDTIDIVESKRIGIDYAEEAKDFLWRYYIKGNSYVSKI
ncbi:DNA-3-methyladenine glycosylase [Clostridium tarantellae]|uniref:Putative 3-methyladenine DNA glycosylase n=1 Tax=Clostridium tarantellae TaxID=39493 RepID=A0A6I1MSK2_9CLOT|nr:DNA-3-methyladenine glycosylase [Clostridium tarantellae]MPQ43871.1 DNA-3-methyladenine glycosylase [Clostridium tarantellae]